MPRPDLSAAAKAFICGCGGERLNAEERAFFGGEKPWGLILFARNCRERAQVRDLVAEFRELVGRPDAPILIDQEGGRVQRLKPPEWPAYPPGRVFATLAEADPKAGRRAAWLNARLIAADLHELGVNVDCLPVLDVAAPGMDDVIGDRSFGSDPRWVAELGRAVADGLLDGGVLPVMKHIPGHGRATADSHKYLPIVDADLAALAETDFAPFTALNDLPMAMTSHILYPAVDRERAATISMTVIRDIIRERISFDGLLMSDDISMNALSGDYATRAAAIYDAGCDLVLHCNGRTEEMRTIAFAAPPLAGIAGERAVRALSMLRQPQPFDREAGREELFALAARGGWMQAS